MTSDARASQSPRGVDDVLITAELASRPSRPPDYKAQSRALELLAQEMTSNPRGVLQKCAALTMELCHADSAGISILEPGETAGIIRWHAAAGAFAANLHATMPQDASPCGTVMERNCVLLFHEAERFFPAVREVEPRIYENLLAPWHVKGEAVGTVWAIKHTPEGRFDAEDARLLQSLARFAAAAFQMISAMDEATAERAELEQRTKDLLESEQRTRLLLAELQHRVRNILAMIRSVARRTGETTETVEDYVQHLDGRISAMARTQALLSRNIDAGVDLRNVLLEELGSQGAKPEQYRLSGPDVALPPKAAEVLGLALHELATNSVKYGALSGSGAAVDVRWTLLDGEAPHLSLVWSEMGVDLPNGTRRRGFGTELISNRVPYELNGTGTMEFTPDGLVAAITFPLTNAASILQTDAGHHG